MKVLFIDSVHPACAEILQAAGMQCFLHYEKSEEEILKEVHEYDVFVIRSKFKITAEIIDRASRLKCIARAGAGMENIDVEYARSRGISCVHAPEGNMDAVAEHAMGMLLMLLNNLGRADREVRNGLWQREANRGTELKGNVVGIIGYGNMGAAFGQRLAGFGVEVLAYDKYKSGFGSPLVKECAMEELFDRCDVVSLHLPLTAETRELVCSSWIAQFRKNFVLINTARGKCVRTADLVSALASGKIRGACLDVLEYESVSFEKMESAAFPEPFRYLIQSDRVVLSPHIAGWTHESNFKISKILADRIISSLKR